MIILYHIWFFSTGKDCTVFLHAHTPCARQSAISLNLSQGSTSINQHAGMCTNTPSFQICDGSWYLGTQKGSQASDSVQTTPPTVVRTTVGGALQWMWCLRPVGIWSVLSEVNHHENNGLELLSSHPVHSLEEHLLRKFRMSDTRQSRFEYV